MKFLKLDTNKTIGTLVFIVFVLVALSFLNNHVGANKKPIFGFLKK